MAHALLCEPGGDRLGRPGLVTTLLPGQPLLVPTGPVWARALAATLARIHAVPVPDGQRDGLLDADAEARWFLRDPAPPPQLANHELGEAIWRTLRANPSLPADEATLVHLDYWRGNVLWTGGAVTGVVDWEEAACGQPAIDVAYCFADLVIAGFADEAARFLAEYRRLTERALPALPQWELAAAARWLPDPGADEPSPADSERARVNFAGFVESALARCGASASAAS